MVPSMLNAIGPIACSPHALWSANALSMMSGLWRRGLGESRDGQAHQLA
jgi:hypothetical protein